MDSPYQFFGQKLKVMSFNIRMSTDSDKDNSWKNRKEEALHLMDYYHPAILGVQEAFTGTDEGYQKWTGWL